MIQVSAASVEVNPGMSRENYTFPSLVSFGESPSGILPGKKHVVGC